MGCAGYSPFQTNKRLCETVRLCETLWDSARLCETLWDSVRFCETLWECVNCDTETLGLCETLWDCDSVRLWDCETMRLWDTVRLWDSVRLCETVRLSQLLRYDLFNFSCAQVRGKMAVWVLKWHHRMNFFPDPFWLVFSLLFSAHWQQVRNAEVICWSLPVMCILNQQVISSEKTKGKAEAEPCHRAFFVKVLCLWNSAYFLFQVTMEIHKLLVVLVLAALLLDGTCASGDICDLCQINDVLMCNDAHCTSCHPRGEFMDKYHNIIHAGGMCSSNTLVSNSLFLVFIATMSIEISKKIRFNILELNKVEAVSCWSFGDLFGGSQYSLLTDSYWVVSGPMFNFWWKGTICWASYSILVRQNTLLSVENPLRLAIQRKTTKACVNQCLISAQQHGFCDVCVVCVWLCVSACEYFIYFCFVQVTVT